MAAILTQPRLDERDPGGGIDPAVVEQVLIRGDLKGLSPGQKIAYYNSVCASLGLNPLTQPFAYITLNGKEVLYAKRDAAEQLRRVHEISIDPRGFVREVIEGCYVVTAPASMPSGRTDVSTGVVPIDGLKGESRANAMMKAETKAKRRVTLSICGLGMLDETEVESIPSAVVVTATARPVAERVTLPPGTVRIFQTSARPYGGDVSAIDEHGVEVVYPVPDRQCFELCEQIAQADPFEPVTLTLVKGVRDGKIKLKAVTRWVVPPDDTNVVEADGADVQLGITAKDMAF